MKDVWPRRPADLAQGRTAFLAVFVLAVVLRVMAVAGDSSPPLSDAVTYDTCAVSMLSGHGYARVPGHPTAWLMPGYSIVLAAVYGLAGHEPAIARLANAFLGAWTCVLILLLGRRVFSPTVGLLAGLYASVSPFFIQLSRLLMTENLYLPLLLLTALAFQDCLSRERRWDFFRFGFWGGLSTLTKPLTIPFFLVGMLFLRWQWSRKPQIAKRLAVALAAFLLPLGVWTVRNALQFKAFIPLATQGGDTLYVSYNPIDGKIFGRRFDDDPVYVEANQRYPLLTHEVDRSRFLTQQALRTIREHPARLPRLTLLKVLYFWSPFDWEIMGNGVYNVASAVLWPFLVIGLMAVWRDWPRYAGVLLPPFAMFLLGLVFYGSPRLRLTVEPFLILLGAGGVGWLWARVSRPVLLGWASAGWVAFNGLLAASGETVRTAARSSLQAVGLW